MHVFKKCLLFRRDFYQNGIFEIQEKTISKEIKSGKVIQFGYDRDERPICWVRMCLHDGSAPLEATEKFCIYAYEQARSRVKYPGETVTMVFDMGGFTMSNMDFRMSRFILQMFSSTYPETLGLCLTIDAPSFFSWCWEVMQRWVDPVSRHKIHFVKRENLNRFIDEDQILNEYIPTKCEVNGTKIDTHPSEWSPYFSEKQAISRLPINSFLELLDENAWPTITSTNATTSTTTNFTSKPKSPVRKQLSSVSISSRLSALENSIRNERTLEKSSSRSSQGSNNSNGSNHSGNGVVYFNLNNDSPSKRSYSSSSTISRYSVENTLERVASLSKLSANQKHDADITLVVFFACVFAIVSIFAGFLEMSE